MYQKMYVPKNVKFIIPPEVNWDLNVLSLYEAHETVLFNLYFQKIKKYKTTQKDMLKIPLKKEHSLFTMLLFQSCNLNQIRNTISLFRRSGVFIKYLIGTQFSLICVFKRWKK